MRLHHSKSFWDHFRKLHIRRFSWAVSGRWSFSPTLKHAGQLGSNPQIPHTPHSKLLGCISHCQWITNMYASWYMTDPYSKHESLFPAQGILPFTAEVVGSRQAKVSKVFQDRFWNSPPCFPGVPNHALINMIVRISSNMTSCNTSSKWTSRHPWVQWFVFFFFFGSFAGSFYYQKKTSFYEPGGDGVFFKIEMNTAYFFRMKCLDWVWIPSSAWRGLGKDPRSSAGMSTRHLTYNFVTRRICFLQKEHHLCYCHPQQTMYTCIYIYIYVWPPRWHLFTKDPNIHTHTQSHSSFQQTYLYKPHRKGAKHVLGHVLPVWGFGFYEMVPGKAIHGSHVEWHDISS